MGQVHCFTLFAPYGHSVYLWLRFCVSVSIHSFTEWIGAEMGTDCMGMVIYICSLFFVYRFIQVGTGVVTHTLYICQHRYNILCFYISSLWRVHRFIQVGTGVVNLNHTLFTYLYWYNILKKSRVFVCCVCVSNTLIS